MKASIVKLASGIAVGAGALVAQPASANMITYDLNNGNSAISGFSGPYGTVTVDLTSATMATITFNSTHIGPNINLFGDVFVNVDATSWSVGGFSAMNSGSGFMTGTYSNGGNAGNVDDQGTFNQAIMNDVNNGFSASATQVSFTLTDTSGTWANASSVLLANGDGNFVAAHILITSYPPIESNGAFVTGFAGGSTETRVPDGGSTAMLLGSATLGLGCVRAWLSRK